MVDGCALVTEWEAPEGTEVPDSLRTHLLTRWTMTHGRVPWKGAYDRFRVTERLPPTEAHEKITDVKKNDYGTRYTYKVLCVHGYVSSTDCCEKTLKNGDVDVTIKVEVLVSYNRGWGQGRMGTSVGLGDSCLCGLPPADGALTHELEAVEPC